jgi:hypothetical protein
VQFGSLASDKGLPLVGSRPCEDLPDAIPTMADLGSVTKIPSLIG